MLSKKKAHRYSCTGFDVADAKKWYLRKGRGHAARVREARGAKWQKVGGGYVTMSRPKRKFDTHSDANDRMTTIMCDAGRLVAYAGSYRKGR